MTGFSYLCRRGARYYYRRRLYLRFIVNRPISISLGTSDAAEARRLVARMSVRWDTTFMITGAQACRGHLEHRACNLQHSRRA